MFFPFWYSFKSAWHWSFCILLRYPIGPAFNVKLGVVPALPYQIQLNPSLLHTFSINWSQTMNQQNNQYVLPRGNLSADNWVSSAKGEKRPWWNQNQPVSYSTCMDVQIQLRHEKCYSLGSCPVRPCFLLICVYLQMLNRWCACMVFKKSTSYFLLTT